MIVAMGLQVFIKAPITAVWAITKIAGKGVEWTEATGVAVLVLICMIAVIVTYAVPKFRRIQGLTDNLNRVTRENLTGSARRARLQRRARRGWRRKRPTASSRTTTSMPSASWRSCSRACR